MSGYVQAKQGDIPDVDEIRLAGEMVLIPGGTFHMGDLSGEGDDDEKPVHSVTVPAFRLGKYEVTFSQWGACVADGGCGHDMPYDEDWGRGDRPVIRVSWDDVQGFIDWLNSKTGGHYRLPSEAEWEYAARAGSTMKYHFGDDESQLCRYGNHATDAEDGYGNEFCSDGVGNHTAEVGRYQPNSLGLYDMHGNVEEWVQDCWKYSYVGAPKDGRALTNGDCTGRVVRGGSWRDKPGLLRSAYRHSPDTLYRNFNLGFRLAQDLSITGKVIQAETPDDNSTEGETLLDFAQLNSPDKYVDAVLKQQFDKALSACDENKTLDQRIADINEAVDGLYDITEKYLPHSRKKLSSYNSRRLYQIDDFLFTGHVFRGLPTTKELVLSSDFYDSFATYYGYYFRTVIKKVDDFNQQWARDFAQGLSCLYTTHPD